MVQREIDPEKEEGMMLSWNRRPMEWLKHRVQGETAEGELIGQVDSQLA